MQRKKVVLITGASSGIGKASAELFAKKGWIVYAGYRRTKEAIPGTRQVYLDTCNYASIKKAVLKIQREEGRLDALVNNAGYGLFGALEDLDPKDVEIQFRTNVLGLIETTRKALPLIRESRGTIVNVSSVVGKIGFPLGSAYSATKFAVEGLSDSLRIELGPLGVKVVVVEPGPIKTNFTAYSTKMSQKILLKKKSPYYPYYLRREKISESANKGGLEPAQVARAIVKACESKNPKTRYSVAGPMEIALFLRWILPDKAVDFILRRAFRTDSD